ncbi:FecR family protein [Asticcacaulis tiandongensis]|uniref:FecR family protein n=1 Tax=Asticcacaulis tiandongensis TaxID=2565365 RepID=UPI00112633DE|nr:FecR domain-containing protein [Asticcacaulis tiandongensis]
MTGKPAFTTPVEQAAEWVVIMRAPTVEPHIERRFEMWIGADPEHAALYADMCALYDGEPLAEAARLQRISERKLANSWRIAAGVGGAIAASWVAVWSLSSLGADQLMPVKDTPQENDYSASLNTGAGETLEIPLPDGSLMILSGQSSVSITYAQDRRDVVLARGEVWFEVASEPERPFYVTLPETEVRVLGTAFNIDLLSDYSAEVSVYRGQVQVDNGGRSHRLSVGEQITTTTGGLSLTRFDATSLPDWRSGWYEAEDVPLERLIAEVNRFSRVPVQIDDATLAAKTVSGRFKVSDPESVLSGIEALYDIKIKRGKTVISLTNSQ